MRKRGNLDQNAISSWPKFILEKNIVISIEKTLIIFIIMKLNGL